MTSPIICISPLPPNVQLSQIEKIMNCLCIKQTSIVGNKAYIELQNAKQLQLLDFVFSDLKVLSLNNAVINIEDENFVWQSWENNQGEIQSREKKIKKNQDEYFQDITQSTVMIQKKQTEVNQKNNESKVQEKQEEKKKEQSQDFGPILNSSKEYEEKEKQRQEQERQKEQKQREQKQKEQKQKERQMEEKKREERQNEEKRKKQQEIAQKQREERKNKQKQMEQKQREEINKQQSELEFQVDPLQNQGFDQVKQTEINQGFSNNPQKQLSKQYNSISAILMTTICILSTIYSMIN